MKAFAQPKSHAPAVAAAPAPPVTKASAPAGAAQPPLRPVMRTVWDRTRGSARKQFHRLKAVILLDGSVRRTPLTDALDRSLLDLPLDDDRVLLDLWREQISMLSSDLELGPVPARVILGPTAREPLLRERDRAAGMSVEADPSELRGTGGVLRDLAAGYDDDDLLLVANAAQVLLEPLTRIVCEAAERGGDVTIIASADGAPVSLSLIHCRALRDLPEVGFIDLKEQALPLMAKSFDVRVHRRLLASGLPIRTPQDYLRALKAYHRLQVGEAAHAAPFSERWRRRFAIVEQGAAVAEDADLHNAVVLRGGRVESHAMVANSVICGGGMVRRREQVIGHLVGRGRRTPVEQDAL